MSPRNALIILTTALVSLLCHLKAERSRYSAQLGEAMLLIENLYIEEVKPRELFESAMDGMASGLDQYSQFIGPQGFQQMEQLLDQEFGGVGIEVEKEGDDQPIIVLSPLVGSPGYRAGLRSGDAILAIDGVSTIGLKQKDCIPRMRGRPGTAVKLRVRHPGSVQEVELVVTREVIKVDSVLGDTRRPDGSWDFHLREEPRIGYLRLTTFGEHTGEELTAALGNGEKCPFDGIILDLRNNAGGLLKAAVETCDQLIDSGRIVSTRGRDQREQSAYDATPSMAIPRIVPITVLINKYSASASEIVAACLQDHQRAVVVGERSWGKGTVQNLLKIEGGRSALKLTTASYWRPSGKNIHRRKDAPESDEWGVSPSPGFEVKLSDEELEKVVLARRDRDLGRDRVSDKDGTARTGNGHEESAQSEPLPQDPFIDPQLAKAIDCLKQQLKSTGTY
jgi:carboxyl-terminal processing protease